MNYRDFFANITGFRGALIFSGAEEYAKEEALKALRKALLMPGFEDLNETVCDGEIEPRRLEELCETLPFMGEARLVIVKNSPLVSDARGDGGFGEAVAQYSARMPEHALLVFYAAGNADKRKKLVQALSKADRIVEFPPLEQHELMRWCRKYTADQGKTLEPAAAARLISFAGALIHPVKDGLDKAIAFAGENAAVTADDIAAVVAPSFEYRSYEMASALIDGNADRTVSMLKQLLLDGENAIALLGSIERALRQHLSVKLMTDRQPAEIASAVGISPAAARALLGRVRRLDKPKLKRAIDACVEADFADKDISLIKMGDIFETSIYSVSRLFKQNAGTGFREYVIAKRMEKAKQLVSDTSMNIRDIAEAVGISTPDYLTKQFKLFYSITPSEMRSRESGESSVR